MSTTTTTTTTTKKVNGIQISLEDILKNVTPTSDISNTIRDLSINDIIKQGKSFMKTTKMTWFFSLIPINEILTDMAYQRPIDQTRVNRIKREFTWSKVDPKCVNYRIKEKKFACMDGLHTLTALKELGYDFIPCKVFIGMTYQEEAQFFSKQGENVKKLSTMDTYRANLEAGEISAIMIHDTTKHFGIKIAEQAGHKKCRSLRKLIKIYNTFNLDGLWFCFELIRDSGWENDPKAYTEAGLNIGYSAYPMCLKKNGKEISQTKYNFLVKVLRRYTTSTEFVDEANYKYGVTVTKHPESCVKELVKEVMVKVNEQYERILTAQSEKIKKVETEED